MSDFDAGRPGMLGYARPGAPADGPTVSERGLGAARGMRGWLILFAVLMFIGFGIGALGLVIVLFGGILAMASGGQGGIGGGIAMFVVGLFYAIPLALTFFPALFLSRCANAIGRLNQSGSGSDLDDALVHMKSYWKFLGIVFLVGIGLYIGAFLVFFVLAGVGAAAGGF